MFRTWSVTTNSPSLVYMCRPLSDLLLVLWPPHLQTVIMKFTVSVFQSILLWFRAPVMTRFFFCVLCFLGPPRLSVPFSALALPHRLEASALLGMVYIDLLRFLLLPGLSLCAPPATAYGHGFSCSPKVPDMFCAPELVSNGPKMWCDMTL
jgi:hypothetical protein